MKTHDAAFASRHLSVTLEISAAAGEASSSPPYSATWWGIRKLYVMEIFNQRRVLSCRPVRADEVARLLCSVSAHCRDGRALILGEKILGMTNDVVVRTAIGGRCPHRDEFLHEIDEAVRLTGGINLADLYPSSWLVRRSAWPRGDSQSCQRNIFRIVESIIRERTATGAPAPEAGDEDLLGVLLRLQKDGVL